MPKATPPLASIVILNWNRIDDTLVCLESVRKLKYKQTEIIIVDNGSEDDSKEKLSKLEDVVFVNNTKNRGFTGGHIDGLSVARGDYVFLLNNDAVVDPHYLDIAIDALEADPAIGAVGGRAYEWDKDHPAYESQNPYFAYQVINPFTAEGIFKRKDDGIKQVVNTVSGSGTVLRKSTIEEVGYLYEPFFAYYEETDLFARMKRAGYTILYEPRLHIWHKNGSSSSSYFQFRQLFKNRFLFAIRNFEKRFLLKFLRSYIKTGVLSTILRFKKTSQTTLHRGFSNAFIYSCFTWPAALISRFKLNRSPILRDNYSTLLLEEQVEISLIIDLTNQTTQGIDKALDSLKGLAKKYGPKLDIVVAHNLNTKLNSPFCGVKVTDSYKENAKNIGWLSAKKQYIAFPGDPLRLDIEKFLSDATELIVNRAWIKYRHDDADLIVDHELLVQYGGLKPGIDNNNNSDRMVVFSYIWDKSKTLISKANYRMLGSKLGKDITHELVFSVNATKHDTKEITLWGRVLAKHYRIYQLRNYFKWLFSPRLSFRLKLARTKNLVFSGITLRRQNFATELKHIRNEVLKTSPQGWLNPKNLTVIKEGMATALNSSAWRQTPIYIICRDRLEPLKTLVKWLEGMGMKNVILIDNDSIFPPLVDYLGKTSYQVIPTRKNVGHTSPWNSGIVKSLSPEKFYIVTDPDVIPTAECPRDVIKRFYSLHKKYLLYEKVGFGLRIDDLPDHYPLKESVVTWESQFWNNTLEENVFEAGIDTTFALYKPFTYRYTLHPSIRTGGKYIARHLPWYSGPDSAKTSDEEKFYRLRANPDINSWNMDELPERYQKELKQQAKT